MCRIKTILKMKILQCIEIGVAVNFNDVIRIVHYVLKLIPHNLSPFHYLNGHFKPEFAENLNIAPLQCLACS